MDTPDSQHASFATKRSLQQNAGRHPPSPGDGYPDSQQASPRRGRHSRRRVGTRQARGMDTPTANKLVWRRSTARRGVLIDPQPPRTLVPGDKGSLAEHAGHFCRLQRSGTRSGRSCEAFADGLVHRGRLSKASADALGHSDFQQPRRHPRASQLCFRERCDSG